MHFMCIPFNKDEGAPNSCKILFFIPKKCKAKKGGVIPNKYRVNINWKKFRKKIKTKN